MRKNEKFTKVFTNAAGSATEQNSFKSGDKRLAGNNFYSREMCRPPYTIK